MIDTPGHESFANLRNRGSSICDLAILVIDIMHGLEPQTLESIQLLKKKKTPFVVILNKVDRCFGWESFANEGIRKSMKNQKNKATVGEVENRIKDIKYQLQGEGFNSELYFKNKFSFSEGEAVEKDEDGEVVRAGIYTYGETVHMFIERKNYNGIFMPGFQEWETAYNPPPAGLKYIDHMVGNVGWNQMDVWVKWYEEVMGFENFLSFDDKQIHTEYSALMSKVMSNGNGRIKFPINEPAEGKKRSQIEEYLDFYEGAGVQHIAVATDDIVKTVSQLKSKGVEFLSTPPEEYYNAVPGRLEEFSHELREDIKKLKALGIMIDADEEGYLLQIFTKPIEDRPTLFFEIIQRMGAKGFGAGNFKALFESIEREQAKRGTL